jgi:penicillin G amidase
LPYRIDRIRTMLSEKEVFSIEDFKRMVTDQHSDYAKLLTPFILKAEDKLKDMNPNEIYALNSLKGWDYEMNKSLTAPTVFEFFRSSFARNIFEDELGFGYSQLFGVIRDYYIYKAITVGPDEWIDDTRTPEKETMDDIIARSFKDCVSVLSKNYGSDTTKWKWGDIHTITLAHPLGTVSILNKIFKLNSKTYAIGGSNHTVSPYSYDSKFAVNHGASERHIFNTANWDESLTVIPTGNSGIPASEFYLSQTEDYLNKKFYKDSFTEPAVKAAAKYTIVLKAAKK